MLVSVILIALIIEFFLAVTWSPIYFKYGILLYKKRYKLNNRNFYFPDVESLSGKFSEKFAPSFVFSKLSMYEIAVREKILQFKLANYTPVLHAYIYYDPESDELVLKCFSNIYAATFLGVILFYIIRDPLFKVSSSTLLTDLSILFVLFGFLFVLFGGIAAYQVQKYKQIISFLIKENKVKNSIESGVVPPNDKIDKSHIQKKINTAKKIIFFSWILAIIGALCITKIISQNLAPPAYCIAIFFAASVIMLIGVLIGSRGAGFPLDTQRFISLLLGYPCWIPALIYMLIFLLMPLIYGTFG